ncbi:MAG: pentapeptide MXKDX repeat protein [Proteobacteria bacterium]|nr:pentapeptide MXKDX repeat protein [Pseudomonadota bacterium]
MNQILLARALTLGTLILAAGGIAQAKTASSMAKPDTMSHSTMKHSTMKHSTMKHSTMKHSAMGHTAAQ